MDFEGARLTTGFQDMDTVIESIDTPGEYGMVSLCGIVILLHIIAIAYQVARLGSKRWKPCSFACLGLLFVLGATAWFCFLEPLVVFAPAPPPAAPPPPPPTLPPDSGSGIDVSVDDGSGSGPSTPPPAPPASPPLPWFDNAGWGEMQFRRTAISVGLLVISIMLLCFSRHLTLNATKKEQTLHKDVRDLVAATATMATQMAEATRNRGLSRQNSRNVKVIEAAAAAGAAAAESAVAAKVSSVSSADIELGDVDAPPTSRAGSYESTGSRDSVTRQESKEVPYVKPDVFISFRFGEAHAQALALKAALEAMGYVVFLSDVKAGGNLQRVIGRALLDARLCIILATKTYGKETNGLFDTGAEMNFIIGKKKPYYLVRMIPFDEEFEEVSTSMAFPPTIMFKMWIPEPRDPDDTIEAAVKAATDAMPEDIIPEIFDQLGPKIIEPPAEAEAPEPSTPTAHAPEAAPMSAEESIRLATFSDGPLGMGISYNSTDHKVAKLVVSSVDDDSQALAQGVQVGEVLLHVAGVPIDGKTKAEVLAMIAAESRPLSLGLANAKFFDQ